MKKQVTVKEAINRGQKIISYPTYGIMIIGIFFSIYLFNLNIHKSIPIIFLLLSILVFPWLYWSFTIVHWRIWAFSNVENGHELKLKAIEAKLILPDGDSFNKTEIRTAKQHKILQKIEPKLEPPEISYYTYPDGKLPEELEIFNSKRNLILSYTFYLVVMLFGFFLIFSENSTIEKKGIGILVLSLIIFAIIKRKPINFTSPQIIINYNGIQTINTNFINWEDIQYIVVISENENWYSAPLLEIKMKNQNEFGDLVNVEHLEFTSDELQKIITIYQQRNRLKNYK